MATIKDLVKEYKSAKEYVTTTKGLEKAYMKLFSGDDFLSGMMRDLVKKKKGAKKDEIDSEKSVGLSKEASSHLAIIAKQSLVIQSMARDTNVMRQNLQKLVKLWGGEPATKKQSEEERKKDVDYFAEQDRIEAEKEALRSKTPTPVGETKEVAKEGGGNFLDNIISFFSSGFMKAIRFLFNPKMLMKVFSKVFLPLTIIATLFNGIMDGFKKYQETGSFTEAITAGLGGMLKFLTFGLFGEDTVKKVFDSISGFFDPVLKTITGIFTGIKDFFVGLFGGKVDVKDETPKEAKKVTPSVSGQVAQAAAAGENQSAAETSRLSRVGTTDSTSPTPAQSSDLQGLHQNWADEKFNVTQSLLNQKIEFSTDPNSPDYPKELKAVDDKYQKLIDNKTSEIEGKRPSKVGGTSFAGDDGTKLTPTEGSSSSGMTAAPSSGGSISSSPSGSTVPSSEPITTAPSGAGLSTASSAIAESQRMESAADQGSIVNAPTNNSVRQSNNQSNRRSADVYDSDLAAILAM